MLPRFRKSRALAGAVAVVVAGAGPAVATSAASASTSWQTLSYRGERFEVPAGWTVHNLTADPRTCVRFDRHAVYEGQEGADPSCPAEAVGVTEAVQVAPLNSLSEAQLGADLATTTIGGQAAITTADAATDRLVAVLPGAGVVVTVSYGTDSSSSGEAVARRILASFTAEPGTTVASAARVAAFAQAEAAENAAAAGTATTATANTTTATAAASIGATEYESLGFDTCTAPSESDMAAWKANSSYRVAGVYIGGINRACSDGYLSASWVTQEVERGWRLLPLYVGPQPSCVDQSGLASISSTDPKIEGEADAEDAVADAKSFDMGAGSPIYYDMEAWDTSDTSCATAVVRFVEGWTAELKTLGYTSGIYGSADAGIAQDIVPIEGEADAPSVLDFAQWDGEDNTSSDYFTTSAWPTDRRIKQFEGDITQSYGGVQLSLDQDAVHSIVVGNRTTIAATSRTGRGDVTISGTTSGWATVDLYAKYYGASKYVLAGTTVAKKGDYSFSEYLRRSASFYVQVGGLNSSVETSTLADNVLETLRSGGKGVVDATVTTNPGIADGRITFYTVTSSGQLVKRRVVYTNSAGVVHQALSVANSSITLVAGLAGGYGTSGGLSPAETISVSH